MKKIHFILILLSAVIFSAGKNIESKNAHIEVINSFLNERPYINATYAVFENNNELLVGAKGYRDLDSKNPLSPKDKLPVASITKQFTAVSILKLKEQGKLNLDDKISKFFPANSKIWNGTKMPKWADEISVHHLLCHSSGLADYVGFFKFDDSLTHEQILNGIVKHAIDTPLTVKIGEKYEYSNTGYVFLGFIIENLSKQNLSEFFKKEFFDPLNMKNTHLSSWSEASLNQLGKEKKYPNRYFAIPTGQAPQYMPAQTDYLLQPFSDGGIISNVEDLMKWTDSLYSGKIISQDSLNLMGREYFHILDESGQEVGVGYGVCIRYDNKGNKTYYHSGRAVGIRSVVGFDSDSKFSYAVLSNVMEYVPAEMAEKLDRKNVNNQFDVLYFREFLINKF